MSDMTNEEEPQRTGGDLAQIQSWDLENRILNYKPNGEKGSDSLKLVIDC